MSLNLVGLYSIQGNYLSLGFPCYASVFIINVTHFTQSFHFFIASSSGIPDFEYLFYIKQTLIKL